VTGIASIEYPVVSATGIVYLSPPEWLGGWVLKWHTDEEPSPDGPRVTMVNMNLTTHGATDFYFHGLDPEFAARGHRIPDEALMELKRGVVNPAIFNAVRYRVSLGVGGLVAFRAGGQSPVAHRAVTARAPRNSFVMRLTHQLPHADTVAR
jgi:hypothetical protein